MPRRGLNSRFVRLMRSAPTGEVPNAGGGGGGGLQGGQQQGGGQQGAGGGGPPQQGQQQSGQHGSGQDGGQGGGQGQGQQQDPFADLLNQSRQQGGQGHGQQQGQPGGGGQQVPAPLTAEDVARIVESTVDRRINAVNNPGGGRGRQQNQQDGQGDGQGQQQVARVDQGARREARLAFREYVGDKIAFLNDTERAAAVQVGTAMIATWDGGGDADSFGKQVADSVAGTMRDLGEMYKRVTIDALRKQGLLKDQPQQGTGGVGSGSAAYSIPSGGGAFVLPTAAGGQAQKNPQVAIQAAAAAAAQYNQAAGWQPTGQQAS